jgi:hypothetical protein
MNDFGVSIKGLVGIVKPRSFGLAKADILNRSFKIESGIGCDPTPNTRRTIKGHWLCDKMPDTLNSYDFEWVISKDGTRVDRAPEEVSDVQPVQLASECTTAPKLVRRKKGK